MRLTKAASMIMVLYQDHSFDNPFAFSLALREEKSDLTLGGRDAPSRLVMKGVGLFFFFFSFFGELFCLPHLNTMLQQSVTCLFSFYNTAKINTFCIVVCINQKVKMSCICVC